MRLDRGCVGYRYRVSVVVSLFVTASVNAYFVCVDCLVCVNVCHCAVLCVRFACACVVLCVVLCLAQWSGETLSKMAHLVFSY